MKRKMTGRGLCVAIAMMACGASMMAQDATVREVYRFRRPTTANAIEAYAQTAYTAGKNDVRTMRGDALMNGKDTVVNFKVNPAGINLGVVTRNKKGKANAMIMSTTEEEKKIFNFDSKKLGEPTAIAYMPDARQVFVAAANKIYMFETRKYVPFATIDNVPFAVKDMCVSPNGYYLAAYSGDRVVVYNLEDRSVRKELTLGETVNDVTFSPESTDMAVLTADGVLNVYNTRTFDMRKMVDDLGEGLACAFNFDGKYVAVAMNPNNIAVVNLLRDSDREYYENEEGGAQDVTFLKDSEGNTLMAYPLTICVEARRMPKLKPFYNKLVADEVDSKMSEWLKMMPGETMEQYQARVTDETRARQRRLFEDEISTDLAGDLLDGVTMSLGAYDRSNGVLALNFDSMPTIFLPVSEGDVTSFKSAGDLQLSDVQYGIMPDDTFEIVYAKVTNVPTGKTYIYDNLNRQSMDFMAADDTISLELLQQQQMEEIKLQETREEVIEEAKSQNVISDHTNISVNSQIVPDYDAAGNKVLNYNVNFTYTVDPEFSVVEDFGPGKYHVGESGAASSMLSIVKKAFEGDFKQYIDNGKKLRVVIKGAADATPIVRGIAYDGAYGEFEDEPVYKDGQLSTLTVTKKDGITENDQLAFMRAQGVRDFLEKNVEGFDKLAKDYRYEVNVSKDKGSHHRRITVDFTFVDAFK